MSGSQEATIVVHYQIVMLGFRPYLGCDMMPH
ncbi:MAG: hypothetical protein LZF60_360094 [Nitrospira sp.]|nr:MAG: hypothetical protein LZF60_360094 [Nitrospira sp.]